ncbi:MAG: RidA family protein [Candidatus Diapherotrites archaeon]|nr:RidA family protein [Candidatus Diapherotrites archaeon]
MEKIPINPKNFTKALGSYSHGIKIELGDSIMVFVTGQIAMDAEGKLVSENVEEQTEFVFQNLQKILQEAGASLDGVVKATIYLTDIKDFSKVSPIRNKYFAKSKPASTLVEISNTVMPGCKVEIEVIAIAEKKK